MCKEWCRKNLGGARKSESGDRCSNGVGLEKSPLFQLASSIFWND